jgi:hypothetical protein
VTDTVLVIVMHKIVVTSSNLIPPDENVNQYDQAEIRRRIYGSKLVLVVEQMQILTIWLVKACLLIMYYRMTIVLPQHTLVIATAIYVAIGFVVMEVLYFGVWCRPFNQYWAVPTNSKQCSAATNHLITNAVFNISSDFIILSIPMPLLFKVRLPKKNKFILVGIFMIGAFTLVAAALNKYYSFSNPYGVEWTRWYLRESFTALLCANLPLTYPLIQRVFNLRNWSSHSYSTDAQHGPESHRQATTTTARSHWTIAKKQSSSNPFRGGLRSTESQENMNDADEEQVDDGPHFITSAIEMDGLKPPIDSSTDTPSSWQCTKDSKKPPDYYHAT